MFSSHSCARYVHFNCFVNVNSKYKSTRENSTAAEKMKLHYMEKLQSNRTYTKRNVSHKQMLPHRRIMYEKSHIDCTCERSIIYISQSCASTQNYQLQFVRKILFLFSTTRSAPRKSVRELKPLEFRIKARHCRCCRYQFETCVVFWVQSF